LQFFNQEERFALSSRPGTLVVRPLPPAGRPADFNGAVGSRLTLERHVDPPTASIGEGVAVELRLAGEGNTALWPNPEPAWAWVALLSLPPVLLSLRGRWPRRPKRRAVPEKRSDLRSAEEALDELVQVLAPDPDRRFGPALATAVRAAGADAQLAARVTAVHERLLARRYGPAAAAAEDASLASEAHAVVRLLG